MKLLVLAALCFLGAANAQVIWRSASNGDVPSRNINGGRINGQLIFPCRAFHAGQMNVGYLDFLLGACFFGHNGRVASNRNYDVATGTIHFWRTHLVGVTPHRDAALAGMTAALQRMYSCRTSHFSNVISGRFVRGRCHIASAGFEHSYSTSEVLCNPPLT